MRVILLLLLCTELFVRADLLGEVIRDARTRNEEVDELSSDGEIFPRFIGEHLLDPKRRLSIQVKHNHANNDHVRINKRKAKNLQKRKRQPNGRQHYLQDGVKVQRKRGRKRKKLMDQPERSKLKEDLEDQQTHSDLTTCIVLPAETTETSSFNTASEITSRFPIEETSAISSTSSFYESMSSDQTTGGTISDITTISTETVMNLETTVNLETSSSLPETTTETIKSTSSQEILTTTETQSTNDEVDRDAIKIFNVKLICKVGKPENQSNLQKVYQCYFGSSDGASFYMPSLQNSILTKEEKNAFPTLNSDKLNLVRDIVSGSSGNDTWQVIESTGVRTRIIERTGQGKKKPYKRRRRAKTALKHHLNRRNRNLNQIKQRKTSGLKHAT